MKPLSFKILLSSNKVIKDIDFAIHRNIQPKFMMFIIQDINFIKLIMKI
jgi:hypothetical protein